MSSGELVKDIHKKSSQCGFSLAHLLSSCNISKTMFYSMLDGHYPYYHRDKSIGRLLKLYDFLTEVESSRSRHL